MSMPASHSSFTSDWMKLWMFNLYDWFLNRFALPWLNFIGFRNCCPLKPLYSVLSTRLRDPWAEILASFLVVRGWYPTQILFFRLIPHLNVQCPINPFIFQVGIYFSSLYSPTKRSLQLCFQPNWGVFNCYAGNYCQICILSILILYYFC